MPVINDSEIKYIDTIFNKNGWINKIHRNNEYIYIKRNKMRKLEEQYNICSLYLIKLII